MRSLLAAAVLVLSCAALRAQVYAPVTDDDDAPPAAGGPQAITGAGVSQSAKDSAPSAGKRGASSSGAATESAAGSGGPASTGQAPSDGSPNVQQPNGQTPVKITRVLAYDNIPAMPEHQLAHGIVRLGGPGIVVAVGVTAYSTEVLRQVAAAHGSSPGSSALTGGCHISMSPRAFSDQGCALWVWMSEKPAGPPLAKNCLWASSSVTNDATIVGGNWYTSMPGTTSKDLSYLCQLPKNGQRYYCNVSAGGWDSKLAPKKCDSVLNFPMGSMPQDVYPDSFPK